MYCNINQHHFWLWPPNFLYPTTVESTHHSLCQSFICWCVNATKNTHFNKCWQNFQQCHCLRHVRNTVDIAAAPANASSRSRSLGWWCGYGCTFQNLIIYGHAAVMIIILHRVDYEMNHIRFRLNYESVLSSIIMMVIDHSHILASLLIMYCTCHLLVTNGLKQPSCLKILSSRNRTMTLRFDKLGIGP